MHEYRIIECEADSGLYQEATYEPEYVKGKLLWVQSKLSEPSTKEQLGNHWDCVEHGSIQHYPLTLADSLEYYSEACSL